MTAILVAHLAAELLSFGCVVLLGATFVQLDWEQFR